MDNSDDLARSMAGPSEQPIFGQAILNAVGWVALAGLGLVSSTVVFRLTGQSAFGVWATILSLRSIALFFDGGLAMATTRDAANRDPASAENIRSLHAAQATFLAAALAVAIFGIAGSAIPGWMLGLSGTAAEEATRVTLVLALDGAVMLLASPLTGMLRGRRAFGSIAVGATAYLILGGVLLVAGATVAGLFGAALGLFAARCVITFGYFLWLRRVAPSLLGAAIDTSQLRRLFSFSAPLWLMAIAAAVAQQSDVPLVGYFASAGRAGEFALGMMPPGVLVGAMWVLIDTSFPRLVGVGLSRNVAQFRILLLAGAALGAFGFVLLALTAGPILRVWVGTSPQLSEVVLWLFAATWTLHMPAHVLFLGAIAIGAHRTLIRLTLVEAAANVVLSVGLIPFIGPVGPAVGTLITLGVSNMVVVPRLLSGPLSLPGSTFVRATAAGYLLGAALALTTWAIATGLAGDDAPRVLVSISVPVAVLAVGGLVWTRHQPRVVSIAERVIGKPAAPVSPSRAASDQER